MHEIIAWQQKRQQLWRSVSPQGQEVQFAGLDFIVYPGVFWPFEDSLPLIENMAIKSGDTVLDVGTGSGVIAIHAARKGASRVLAVDRNPKAVQATRANAEKHDVADIVEVRESDVFDAVGDEQFEVITANLPWLDRVASDEVEAAQWDTGFRTNQRFLFGLADRLNRGGRAYVTQGNYSAVELFNTVASKARLSMSRIGFNHCSKNPSLEFYAYEIRPFI